MKELIKIQEHKGIPTVDARKLHEHLESKQDFSTWIKARIEKYEFNENTDYIRLHKKMEANNATIIEYYLALDMAKEISMVENNEKGKEYRKYFISAEKAYRDGKVEKKQLRDKSKAVRNTFTETLKNHGYTKQGHYIQTTKQMKDALNIKGKKDELSIIDLKKILVAETLGEIKIEQSKANGYREVNPICLTCCKAVIETLENKQQLN